MCDAALRLEKTIVELRKALNALVYISNASMSRYASKDDMLIDCISTAQDALSAFEKQRPSTTLVSRGDKE